MTFSTREGLDILNNKLRRVEVVFVILVGSVTRGSCDRKSLLVRSNSLMLSSNFEALRITVRRPN